MVKRLAWHFQGRAGRFVELDDLMQAGYLGLVDASQKYSAREGVTFATCAAQPLPCNKRFAPQKRY